MEFGQSILCAFCFALHRLKYRNRHRSIPRLAVDRIVQCSACVITFSSLPEKMSPLLSIYLCLCVCVCARARERECVFVCVCVCVHAPAHACVCSLLYAVDSPCVWQLRQGNTILCQRHAGHSNCNIPSSYHPPEPYLVAALCPDES